jgi:chromosome segregation ATPase
MVRHINGLKKALDAQTIAAEKRGKKCRGLTRELNEFKQRTEVELNEYVAEIKDLEHAMNELHSNLSEMTSQNQQLKREFQQVSAEYRDFKALQEEEATTLQEQYHDELRQMQAQKEETESELRQELGAAKESLVRETEAVKELESAVQILKKSIRAQKSSISEKETEIAALKQVLDETETALIERNESDKEQLIASYEKAVAEIREQCENHRNDVQRLAEELAESEKKLRQTKEGYGIMKREKVRLEKECQSQQEQMDRERKLWEASSKSALLNAESEWNAKFNEQKVKWEGERRKLFSVAAESFRQFYNPQDAIDERSFRKVIDRAKDELTALSGSNACIRRIVGAGAGQKTDDAVAQALLSQRDL